MMVEGHAIATAIDSVVGSDPTVGQGSPVGRDAAGGGDHPVLAAQVPPLLVNPSGPKGPLITARENSVCNGVSPWLSPLAMLITQDLALPAFFGRLAVRGREHLPKEGAVLLAPTHRARWDALLVPYAAGRRVTGRDCRFMVTRDEMQGLQGWLLQRLGCFAVDQGRPTLASLRLAVKLLQRGEQLVVFPEGRIHRQDEPLRLHQGLGRLAQLAASQGVDVQVLPMGIAYGQALPSLGGCAAVQIGAPLQLQGEGRHAAQSFTTTLAAAMAAAEAAARDLVGRPLPQRAQVQQPGSP
jgi:1-acyl-sn-glycerol-3-phosphate acyltransferase